MANSRRFKYLQARINELRKHMLPEPFSATGDYDESELDKSRGFRVLAHAEFESYLEDIALEILDEKLGEWNRSLGLSYILFCFLAAYHCGWVSDETDKEIYPQSSRKPPKDKITEITNVARVQYQNGVINKNNGIKISNLKTMFLPLGVDFSMLDQSWLGSLDSFGQGRGNIAHQSKKTQKQIDPKSEWDDVMNVINGLKIFDKILAELRKK